MAACRLAILERRPAPLLTLFCGIKKTAHLVWNKWRSNSRKVERWRPRVVPQPKGRINWILLRYSAQILPVLLETRNAFAIVSLGVKPLINGRKPDDFHPRAQIKQFFKKLMKLVSWNGEAIREFSDKSGPKKIVAEVCWAPCPYKNAPREEAKRRLKGSEWTGWTGSTSILTGLDCTTPNSFNSLIPRLLMTLSFPKNFFGGGWGAWSWNPSFSNERVCYTSCSLGYIRVILGISANFFRVG